jgi:hypothetical protein
MLYFGWNEDIMVVAGTQPPLLTEDGRENLKSYESEVKIVANCSLYI